MNSRHRSDARTTRSSGKPTELRSGENQERRRRVVSPLTVAATREDPTDEGPTVQEGAIGLGTGEVVLLPLRELDLTDRQFMFRAALRTGDLRRSLHEEGQQIPIVVRRLPNKKYQIISGFRRCTAAKALGWSTIAAIVRKDLTDEQAFRASVLENTARRTYSDIDRAFIIRAYRERGYASREIGRVLGLNIRQVRNLHGLLQLPEAMQQAIDDPEQRFSTTHALALKVLMARFPSLEVGPYIREVNEKDLSVPELRRLVVRTCAKETPAAFSSLFQGPGTNWKKGEIRLAPIKVELDQLSRAEGKKLKRELQHLLKEIQKRGL